MKDFLASLLFYSVWAVVGLGVAVAINSLKPMPSCDPNWPVWQCNGTPKTNSPRCCAD